MHAQGPFVDNQVVPHGAKQGLFANDLAGMKDQRRQDVERPLSELNRLAVELQSPTLKEEHIVAETIGRGARSRCRAMALPTAPRACRLGRRRDALKSLRLQFDLHGLPRGFGYVTSVLTQGVAAKPF